MCTWLAVRHQIDATDACRAQLFVGKGLGMRWQAASTGRDHDRSTESAASHKRTPRLCTKIIERSSPIIRAQRRRGTAIDFHFTSVAAYARPPRPGRKTRRRGTRSTTTIKNRRNIMPMKRVIAPDSERSSRFPIIGRATNLRACIDAERAANTHATDHQQQRASPSIR